MYTSFTPDQMGLRSSRVWKREGDNRYIFPATRTRQPSSPAIRRDAKGRIIGEVCQGYPRLSGKTVKARAKRPSLQPEHAFGRKCACVECKVYGKRAVGTVEHATKDHL